MIKPFFSERAVVSRTRHLSCARNHPAQARAPAGTVPSVLRGAKRAVAPSARSRWCREELAARGRGRRADWLAGEEAGRVTPARTMRKFRTMRHLGIRKRILNYRVVRMFRVIRHRGDAGDPH